MHTTALTHTHPAPQAPHLPVEPFAPAAKKTLNPSLESLLKNAPLQRAGTDIQPEIAEPAPGIFMGLRIALFFNAGLGIVGLLAYEAWTLLAR